LTIYIALVRILHSAELNQIAGALKIPAKAMFLDHRSAGGFFWKLFSSKNWVFNHIVHPTFSRSAKKEKKK